MFYLKVCNYILAGITGPRSDLHAVLNVMVRKDDVDTRPFKSFLVALNAKTASGDGDAVKL